MNRAGLVDALFDFSRHIPGLMKDPGIKMVNSLRKRRLRRLLHPLWLTVFVTNRCNARCSHCFYWADLNSGRDELKLDDWEMVLSSFRRRLRTISLTGGEPFMRKDLADIYLIIDRLKLARRVLIHTNGHPVKTVSRAVERMISGSRNRTQISLHISLDGPREVHDTIRGVKGIFDSAVVTARRMKELALKSPLVTVGVFSAISKRNIGRMCELARFVREELGIAHGFDFVRSTTTDAWFVDSGVAAEVGPEEGPGECLSQEEMDAITAALDGIRAGNFRERLDGVRAEYAREIRIQKRRPFPCLAGIVDGVIYPTGDVSFCEFTRPFANLREEGLSFVRLWSSPRAEEMRKKIQSCVCTHPCHLIRSMAYDDRALMRLSR